MLECKPYLQHAFFQLLQLGYTEILDEKRLKYIFLFLHVRQEMLLELDELSLQFLPIILPFSFRLGRYTVSLGEQLRK